MKLEAVNATESLWFTEVSPINLNRQAVKRANIAASLIAHVTRTYTADDSEEQNAPYERPVYKIDTDTLQLLEFRASPNGKNEFGHSIFATVAYNRSGHVCSMGGSVNDDGSISWSTYAD